jgi:hypothetical protein
MARDRDFPLEGAAFASEIEVEAGLTAVYLLLPQTVDPASAIPLLTEAARVVNPDAQVAGATFYVS